MNRKAKTVHLMVSVDCEATQHSIRNPQLGNKAVDGILKILSAEDLPATLFVIPTDLEESPLMYRQAHESGHEVGLHVHPADLGYEEFLGIYGQDDQKKILAEAADRFAQVMGYAPKSIRSGYFSTNDYTFQVLAELGFSHGSMSCPTRILPECASVWAGAPLDIHYAHRCNRLLAGNLNFVEIPVTIDPDSHIWGGRQPLDLRVELIGPKDHWHTINKAVERQLEQNTAVPYISIYSHNIFDFSDERNFHRETLQKMIKAVKEIAAGRGCRVFKATHEDVMTTYRRLCPLERAKTAELELDTRARI